LTQTKLVAKDVYLIDTEIFGVAGFAAAYLLAEKKPALIETGAATSARTIMEGLRQLGFDPTDIEYIAVTHLHLDHAGGVGNLAAEMPKAQVLVHERGAKHLIDPSRLMQSVTQFWGAEEAERYGSMAPIDPKRIRAMRGGEVIELSETQAVSIIATPGHAFHHMCLHESKNRGLFTGDGVGIFFPEEGLLIPATPPPEFDMDIAVSTIERLMQEDIELLYFSHFGVTDNVRQTLQRATHMLRHWGEILRGAAKEHNLQGAIDCLRAELQPMLARLGDKRQLYEYQENMILPMSAAGYMSYFDRKGKASEAALP
jgi:glyoxylase-like metal-dependent hydrolase (beta-lactamase superfamily II)